jgi:cytochrome P450 family 130
MNEATEVAPALVFDPFDVETMRSPFALYARLRDEAPLHFQPYAEIFEPARAAAAGTHGFYVFSRFADVFEAARDPATFSSARGLSLDGGDSKALGLAPTLVMMDPPDHTTYRRLVARGFTPRQVATLEPGLRTFVEACLDDMDDALARHGEVDVVDKLARPVPSFVVATYLGVPEADRAQFDRWTNAIVAANANEDMLGGARDAVIELYGYFSELIDHRRRQPGDDMVSELVQASLDDAPLALEQILGYAFVMVAGGNDTATGLLGGSIELLADHADQRQILVDDPNKIASAIDEFLRLTSPVQGLSRHVTRDTSLRDIDIPAGSRVHLLYAAANRDPREFGPDADQLDVERRINRLMTFTTGPHYCLGAAAARLQGRVALEGLLRRYPSFRVDSDRAPFAPGAFVRRHLSLPFSVP